jgi:hypothetical protein
MHSQPQVLAIGSDPVGLCALPGQTQTGHRIARKDAIGTDCPELSGLRRDSIVAHAVTAAICIAEKNSVSEEPCLIGMLCPSRTRACDLAPRMVCIASSAAAQPPEMHKNFTLHGSCSFLGPLLLPHNWLESLYFADELTTVRRVLYTQSINIKSTSKVRHSFEGAAFPEVPLLPLWAQFDALVCILQSFL